MTSSNNADPPLSKEKTLMLQKLLMTSKMNLKLRSRPKYPTWVISYIFVLVVDGDYVN